MAFDAEEAVRTSLCILFHNPTICQTWVAKGKSNTTCAWSSWAESQLTQFVQHCMPLS